MRLVERPGGGHKCNEDLVDHVQKERASTAGANSRSGLADGGDMTVKRKNPGASAAGTGAAAAAAAVAVTAAAAAATAPSSAALSMGNSEAAIAMGIKRQRKELIDFGEKTAADHRRNNSDGSVPSMLSGADEEDRMDAYSQHGDDFNDEDDNRSSKLSHRRPRYWGTLEEAKDGLQPRATLQNLALTEPGIIRAVTAFLAVPETVNLTAVCVAFLDALQGCPLRLDRLHRAFDIRELSTHILRAPILDDDDDNDDDGEVNDNNNDDDDDDEDEEMMYVGEPASSRAAPPRRTNWTIAGLRARARPGREHELWHVLNESELVRLVMTGDVDYIDAADMENFRRLQCFDAGVSCQHLENAHVLRSLPRLSHLYVRNTRNLVSADFVPASSRLEELSMYMCKSLRDIDALGRCANLTVLDLGGCNQLRDIEALASCRALEKLSVADCARVTSIAPLRGHARLFHLDVSGCARVDDLSPLETLAALSRVKLKRCDVLATEPLLASANAAVALEAKNNLRTYRVAEVDAILPQLLRRLRAGRGAAEGALEVLSAFAFREGLRSSTTLAHSGAVPVLLELAAGSDDDDNNNEARAVRRLAFEVIARVSQTREAVPEVSRHGTGAVVARELHRVLCARRGPDAEDLDIMQYCASTVLFLAAVQGERERLVQESPEVIPCLVRLVQVGTSETVAEAAGALWNLAASLEIGSIIAGTPGAVAALAGVLRTGSITARLQASGALRNLAILDANKDVLAASGVLEPLVAILHARAMANASLARDPAMLRSLDELSEDETMLAVKAAATLRILSTRESVQAAAGALGAAVILVALLSDREAMLRRQACGALLALSFNATNRTALVAADAVAHLVRIVDASHNESMVISAAGCLWNLAMHDGIGRVIARDPLAIPALVRRLDAANPEIICRVAGALRSLAHQEVHKELIVVLGGIPKLVRHVALPASKALPQVLAALSFVASGPTPVRAAIAAAGAIPRLAEVLLHGAPEVACLALSALAHLAPDHAEAIARHVPASRLAGIFFEAAAQPVPQLASRGLVAQRTIAPVLSGTVSPVLVREDACYILQRIAMAGTPPLEARAANLAHEDLVADAHLARGLLPMRRVRGVPGDLQVANAFDGTLRFFSYATAVAADRYVARGKVFFEVEIIRVTESPSFGWASRRFAAGQDYLSSYGVGSPMADPAFQDSWSIDGVGRCKWPGQARFGRKWGPGDVLTVAADLDTGDVIFGLNGSFAPPMGVAFASCGAACPNFRAGIAPAISASQGTSVRVNLGHRPMRFGPPAAGFVPFCT